MVRETATRVAQERGARRSHDLYVKPWRLFIPISIPGSALPGGKERREGRTSSEEQDQIPHPTPSKTTMPTRKTPKSLVQRPVICGGADCPRGEAMDWVGGEAGGEDTACKKVGSGAADCYLEGVDEVNG